MENDIVEKLRWYSNGDLGIHDAVREAADEIEQLREKMRQDAWVKPKLIELRAEIEKLRGRNVG